MESRPRDIALQLARALQAEDLELAIQLYQRGAAPLTPQSHHLAGLALFEAGHPEESIAAIYAGLEEDPNNLKMLLDLGVILKTTERYDQLSSLLLQALPHHPHSEELVVLLGELSLNHPEPEKGRASLLEANRLTLESNPDILEQLGRAHHVHGDYTLALEVLEQGIRLAPQRISLFNLLALTLQEAGRSAEAEAHLGRALQISPEDPLVLHCLGLVLQKSNRHSEAISHFKRALQSVPDAAPFHYQLGQSLVATGALTEALASMTRALELSPRCPDYLLSLGGVHLALHQFPEAEALYQRALEARPNSSEAHFNQGQVYRVHNQTTEALHAFSRAHQLSPTTLSYRWSYALTLPILYRSPSEIREQRVRFEEQLTLLTQSLQLTTSEEISEARAALGSRTNFHLAYQQQDDRRLQAAYGELAGKILRAACPQWTVPLRAHSGRRKIKVGFASAFFWGHTVGKLFNGWLTQLNPERFEVYGFYTGSREDPYTEALEQSGVQLCRVGESLNGAASAIREAKLDVLIFPELGMNATLFALGALRLAPVQCAAWGHPITPGLTTIDYFLSARLMEPQNGATHYNETLIQLPNLSLYYEEPRIAPSSLSRTDFGVESTEVLYLCTQSLFKYLPQHDAVWPRIAAAVPGARFVFIANKSAQVTGQFEARLKTAFEKEGLESAPLVRLLPQQSPADYLALNHAADIYLDSIGWSGGNTTLEALTADLPMVTCPGSFMRGRHTAGILNRMGMEQEVTHSPDSYITLAIELGRSETRRGAFRAQVHANKERVFRDREAIKGLEEFLEDVTP